MPQVTLFCPRCQVHEVVCDPRIAEPKCSECGILLIPVTGSLAPVKPGWYIARNKAERLGPFSLAQLKQLAEGSLLQPAHRVWRTGMPKWVAARRVQGLFSTAKVKINRQPVSAPLSTFRPAPGSVATDLSSRDLSTLDPTALDDSENFCAAVSRRRWVLAGTMVAVTSMILLTIVVGGLLLSPATADVRVENHESQQSIPDAAGHGRSDTEPAVVSGLERVGFSRTACLTCKVRRTTREVLTYSDRQGFGFCERCGRRAVAYSQMIQDAKAGYSLRSETVQDAKEYMQLVSQLIPEQLRLLFMFWGQDSWDVLTAGVSMDQSAQNNKDLP